MRFLDGVYIDSANGSSPVRFRWVKAPTSEELTYLAHIIAQCIGRFLERQGLLERDALVEGRLLDVKQAGDARSGMLLGVYRHLGDNIKMGVGYNFTDFSDDLTDLDYDSQGMFVNVIGKF